MLVSRVFRYAIYLVLLIFLSSLSSCSKSTLDTEKVNKYLSEGINMEHEDPVSALKLYEDAYDFLLEDKDSSLLRQTHYLMGQLYLRYGLSEECIENMYAAFRIDSAHQDSMPMYYDLRFMAYAYESLGEIEMARNTISVVKDDIMDFYPYRFIFRELQSDYFSRYALMKEYKDKLPNDYFNEIVRLTPLSNELELVLHAWTAEHEGDKKIAVHYYKKLLDATSSYVKAFAMLRLAEYSVNCGNKNDAMTYLGEFRIVFSKIKKREYITKRLLQVRARYMERRQQREIMRLEIANKGKQYYISSIAILVFFLMTFLLLILRNYRQRQQIYKMRIGQLQNWRNSYLLRSDSSNNSHECDSMLSGLHYFLCKKIEKGELLNSKEWDEIEEKIIISFPNFRKSLFELCKLSLHEYHVCLLLKSGMLPNEIAYLTSRSPEAISSTRRRLYTRAYGKKGSPKDWDDVIKVIL